MSIGGVLTGILSAAGQAGGKANTSIVNIPATAKGKGLDGIAYVRSLMKSGAWTKKNHAAQVFAAMNVGAFQPWRWVPVAVDPRLTVFVMHDALGIGDSPPARIPINQSNCQRLADRLGKQLGTTLLMPTPRIVDAVHLAAIKSGRTIGGIDCCHWGDPCPAPPKSCNKGQDLAQWLKSQEAIRDAVAKAGGYPKSSGALSTVGKDLILAPRIADIAKPADTGGEATGAKDMIYGWPYKGDTTYQAHAAELRKAGWSVLQPESGVHVDNDGANVAQGELGGDKGSGGFWDYSSTVRLVHGSCLLDGKPCALADVYAKFPGLVYVGATRAIPSRYPLLPRPVA